MNNYLRQTIEAAIKAGIAILKVYDQPEINVINKEDNSPLTAADKAANEEIIAILKNTPYPIISEENKQIDYVERQQWERCWIVDPLDGTKEFIKKNGEFTVNIALCDNGRPIFGVIYVPVSRELYYGDVALGKAYKTELNANHELAKEFFLEEDRISPASTNKELIRIVGSRSHMNDTTVAYVEKTKALYDDVEIVSKGSSLKFCLVAEGKADVYPRFAPTMEWDTAAGHAICNAVGLKVISKESNAELEYNKRDLLNPHFLVSN